MCLYLYTIRVLLGARILLLYKRLMGLLVRTSLPKTVKRFQMKSTGFRGVQHTGLQSTQTRRNYMSNNIGKQGTQTRGIFEFPSIPTSVVALHVKQHTCSSFFSICCNLELISISYNYHAATDIGMFGNSKMPLVCVPCLPVLFSGVARICLVVGHKIGALARTRKF